MRNLINIGRIVCGFVVVFFSIQLRETSSIQYNKSIQDSIVAITNVDNFIEESKLCNEQLPKTFRSTRKSIKEIRAFSESFGTLSEDMLARSETLPKRIRNMASALSEMKKMIRVMADLPTGPSEKLKGQSEKLYAAVRSMRDGISDMEKLANDLELGTPEVAKDYLSALDAIEQSLLLYESQIESWERGPVKQMPETLGAIQIQLRSTISLLGVAKGWVSKLSLILVLFGIITILGGLNQLVRKNPT